jgi:hypothetical protein
MMLTLARKFFFINYKFITIFTCVVLEQLRQVSPNKCRTGKEKYTYQQYWVLRSFRAYSEAHKRFTYIGDFRKYRWFKTVICLINNLI